MFVLELTFSVVRVFGYVVAIPAPLARLLALETDIKAPELSATPTLGPARPHIGPPNPLAGLSPPFHSSNRSFQPLK